MGSNTSPVTFTWLRIPELLPLWVKRKEASVVMARGAYPLNMGYLGVIWPRVVDGEIVDGSCLVKAGDLDIVETLGAGDRPAGLT